MIAQKEAPPLTPEILDHLRELAAQLRVDSIRCSTAAGSGHPTSGMSAADLMAVLLARHLRYDFSDPGNRAADHLIFSKGHASPLLYAMYRAAGAVSDAELLTFRKHGSRLEGHPTPAIPWVDVATGSLGQGIGYAVGVALAGRKLDHLDYRVWTLCGDSEMAEGSVWEAIDKAAHYKLGNLTVIVDVNRLGQRGETELGWDTDSYRRRVEAFGARPIVIDGHDVAAIDRAYLDAAAGDERPAVVIARTVKGKGFPEIEDKNGWHGKALPPDMAERAIAGLGGMRNLRVTPPAPPAPPSRKPTAEAAAVQLPTYRRDEKVATRKAFGDALLALGHARDDVIAFDGEVGNSTHLEEFQKQFPDRYFEMWISEQQMVASAVGAQVQGYVPYAATFAAFFSRAYDFIRMSAISRANLRLCGSHAGTEIGQDGPSQMGLEDLAALRAVHGSTVLYPCCPNQAAALTALMAEVDGIVYLRTTRGAYPVVYDPGTQVRVGGSAVLRQSDADRVALIGAGVTVHHCLDAAEELQREGVHARVIDLYSVKPVDLVTLREAAAATGGRLVVVEDHYPEGGIGGAVLEALALEPQPPRVAVLGVRGLPASGTPEELMDDAGISAPHVVRAALRLVGRGE